MNETQISEFPNVRFVILTELVRILKLNDHRISCMHNTWPNRSFNSTVRFLLLQTWSGVFAMKRDVVRLPLLKPQ